MASNVEQGAYLYWDKAWREEDEPNGDWSKPEPWVVSVIADRRTSELRRVLDVGCGMGRHAITFARAGLECYGIDRSESAVSATQRKSELAGVEIGVRVGDFENLPYDDGFFDYALAWNVVYHGSEEKVGTAINEIARVLRKGGIFQTTMLSKRNIEYGRGTEVSPNSWVQPGGPEDKEYPHVYCDERDFLRLHRKFKLLAAFDEQQRTPGSYHWHLLFERGTD